MHKLLTTDEREKLPAEHTRHEFRRAAHRAQASGRRKILEAVCHRAGAILPRNFWYIDAFAGTGSRTVRHEARVGDLLDAAMPERIEQRRGSARIAIDVTPQFDRLVFIEDRSRPTAQLFTSLRGNTVIGTSASSKATPTKRSKLP